MSEIQKKTDKELQKMLIEKREALRAFRFDTTGTKIKDVKKGANTRRNIAQILTELRTRETNG